MDYLKWVEFPRNKERCDNTAVFWKSGRFFLCGGGRSESAIDLSGFGGVDAVVIGI